MKFGLFNKSYYANDLTAFIPQFWAMESLAVLEESLVAANLCYRDFENTLAKFGDTVNCRRPNRFEPVRKDLTDNVTVQDATATNVPVKLNQHVHVSFLIRDGEESKSQTDLISEYIVPAMKGNARFLDRMVLGQYGQFYGNNSGALGGLTANNAQSYIVGARKKAEQLLWPDEVRPLIVNPNTEAQFLNTALFVSAEKVGDQGTALRTASMGLKFGFNVLQTQQMASVASGNTVKSGTISQSGGYAAGTTVLTVTGFTGAVATGSFVTVSGYPSRVVAHTETLSNTTSITLLDPLPAAILNADPVVAYTPGAVNFSSGYAAGWSKPIVVNGFTVAPQVGQMVTFTNATPTVGQDVYTIVGKDVSTTSITLDRPLNVGIANTDAVNIGPAGDYSFSFLKEAIALVVRPLAMPMQGAGARSAVANYNNLSMRATITYDGNKQGHLVTLDFLCGITVLDKTFGMVMLG